MVIATVRDFANEVVYTSEAGSFDQVWSELTDLYPSDRYLLTLNDEEDFVFVDPRNGGGIFGAELTPVTFD